MTAIGRLWAWWVTRTTRPEDARALALVRILVCLAVVGDLTGALGRGLGPAFFAPFSEGGVSVNTSADYILDDLLGPGSGSVAVVVALVCFSSAAVGLLPRLSLLVGLLAYAQLGAIGPDADRAIDRALRTVGVLLLFTDAHRAWSLQAWLRGRMVAVVDAWQAGLVRWLLVLMYLAAGLVKVGALVAAPRGAAPALYRILTDPTAARLDHLALADWTWPFHVLWLGTIALELSAPLLLTRWAPWWGVLGATLHLGIAATMGLGVFSWGMLALYPAVFALWWPRSQRWGPPATRREPG